MFIPTSSSKVFFLVLSFLCLLTSASAIGTTTWEDNHHETMVNVYNTGTVKLAKQLEETQLNTIEKAWVLRQHRAVKIRVEILLEKGICPADIELIRGDIKELVNALEAIRSQKQFVQRTQLDTHP